MRVVSDDAGFLLGGLLVTIELTGLGFAGALLLGTVLAVFRVSPIPPLRVAGAAYAGVLRNMPLLSLLVLVVFGLPDIGLTVSLFSSAALCLAAFGAAFVCEAMRSGINTVAVGQGRPPARLRGGESRAVPAGPSAGTQAGPPGAPGRRLGWRSGRHGRRSGGDGVSAAPAVRACGRPPRRCSAAPAPAA